MKSNNEKTEITKQIMKYELEYTRLLNSLIKNNKK